MGKHNGFGRSVPGIDNEDVTSFGAMNWLGNVEDGMPIYDVNHHIASIQKAINEREEVGNSFPLLPEMPNTLIQKAVFSDHRNQPAYESYANKLKVGYAQQFMKANPDSELTHDIQKAMTTGSSLMHVISDMDVTLLYKRAYPIQALIPVEGNRGKTAQWDIVQPFGFNTASFGSEDPNITESDISTEYGTNNIKYMYASGRVTLASKRVGEAQYPARDVKTLSIDASQEAMRALRERSILGVTRDVSNIDTLGFADAGSYEYPGLYETITGNTSSPNYVTSNGSDYDNIRADMRESFRLMVKDGMRPNLIIGDYTTFDTLSMGFNDFVRIKEPIMQFADGISKLSMIFPGGGAIPIIPTEFLPMDSGTGALFMLDTRLLARRVLWQDMYMDLAQVNTSEKFVISAAETLIDKTNNSDLDSSLMGGVFSI